MSIQRRKFSYIKTATVVVFQFGGHPYLITNTVTWLIWIIGPINLAIRIRLWYYCCLLRQFLCQCR